MTNTVLCKKYNEELEALERPPFPGPKGLEIQETISKKAWLEWQEHQTRLINEKHLNMMDLESRKFIQEQQEKFFNGEDFEQAEGYVPEADKSK